MRTLGLVLLIAAIIGVIWTLADTSSPSVSPVAPGEADPSTKGPSLIVGGTAQELKPTDAPAAMTPADGSALSTSPTLFVAHVTTSDGTPIEGVRIIADKKLGAFRFGLTDAQGRTHATHAPTLHGVIRVVAIKHGYVPRSAHVRQLEADTITLDRGAVVTGTVVLLPDERPIAGAAVRAFVGDRQREEIGAATMSESDGTFTLTLPAGAPAFLVARIDGWHAGVTSDVFPTERPVVIRIGGGGTIQGNVTQPSGAPAVGVAVWLMRPNRAIPPRGSGGGWAISPAITSFAYPRVLTDSDGKYIFRGVALNQPRTAIAWLHQNAEIAHEDVTLTSEGETQTCDIQLPAMSTISYRVVDADGDPLKEDVQVDFKSDRVWFAGRNPTGYDEPQPKRDTDGWRTIENLMPGPWMVRAWFPSGEMTEMNIDVAPNDSARVTLQEIRGLTITGIVVDADNRPAVGVGVRWWDGETVSRSAETDTNGKFTLENVPDEVGEVSVDPSHMSLAAMERPTRPNAIPVAGLTVNGVRPGGAPLRLKLPKGAIVIGRLELLKAGDRVQFNVYSRHVSGRSNPALGPGASFSRGEPRLGAPVMLRIEHPEHAPWFLLAPGLKAGETHDFGTIGAPKKTSLIGQVLAPDGTPVSKAHVKPTFRWLRGSDVHTDSNGRFALTRLSRGELWVRVNVAGRPAHLFRVACHDEENATALQLSAPGRLNVRLENRAGEALDTDGISISWDLTHPLDADLDDLRLYYPAKNGRTSASLQPGMYRVSAYHNKLLTNGKATVRAGETTDVLLVTAK